MLPVIKPLYCHMHLVATLTSITRDVSLAPWVVYLSLRTLFLASYTLNAQFILHHLPATCILCSLPFTPTLHPLTLPPFHRYGSLVCFCNPFIHPSGPPCPTRPFSFSSLSPSLPSLVYCLHPHPLLTPQPDRRAALETNTPARREVNMMYEVCATILWPLWVPLPCLDPRPHPPVPGRAP